MENRRERLAQYWKLKNFKNEKAFAAFLGLHQDHISKIDVKGSSGKLAEKLAEKCPDLNISWVITGEGEMIVGQKETPQGPEHVRRLHEAINETFLTGKDDADQLILAGKILKMLQEDKH